jgi:zinc transporter ZupT
MRPLGFESPARRFKRSLRIGSVAGIVAVIMVTGVLILASRTPTMQSALVSVASAFGLGFAAGFVLALMWPDFAPAQPENEGDAEAGVPARLVPPVPTLSGKFTAKTPAPKD